MYTKYIKTFLIIFYSIVIFNLLHLPNSKSGGYELSIYTSMPNYFWLSFITIISLTYLILILYILSDESLPNYLIIFIISIILLIYQIIFLLPILRGYLFYGSEDPMSHVGFIVDIISTGYVGEDNFYPMIHILVAELTMLSKVSYLDIIMWVPSLISFSYVLFTILFCKRLNIDQKKLILLLCSCSVPLFLGFHTYFTPYGLAFMAMIPMTLYTYIIQRRMAAPRYISIFIVLLIVVPFFHILIAFVLIYTLVMIYFFENKLVTIYDNLGAPKSLRSVYILAISTLVWFLSSTIWAGSIKKVANFLYGIAGVLPVDRAFGQIDSAASYYSFFELMLVLFNWIGAYIIFGITSTFFGLYFLRNVPKSTLHEKLFFYLLVVFTILMLVLMFIFPTGVDPLRPLRLLALPLHLFVGIMLYRLVEFNQNKVIKVITILLIFMIPAVICISNVHYSPTLLRPNEQITYMEFCGMDWLLIYKDLDVHHIGITPKCRFIDAILGNIKAFAREDFPKSYKEESYVGDHFNKIRNGELNSNKYLTVSLLDELLHTEIWSKTHRFNLSDFNYIESSSNLIKIYNNGEFRSFLFSSSGIY